MSPLAVALTAYGAFLLLVAWGLVRWREGGAAMSRTEQEILELAASVLPGQGTPVIADPLPMEEVLGVLARRLIALEAAVKATPLAMAEEAVAGIDEPQVRAAVRKMLGLDS